MNRLIYSLLIIGLTGALLASAGCKQPSQAPQATPQATQKKTKWLSRCLPKKKRRRPNIR